MDSGGDEFKDFANGNLFLQLTDDLLILILSMLSGNLKFLCQCMIVSRRFALLIPLISSGTLSIPQPQERPRFEIFQNQVIYVFKALKSFGNIRSLHLEFIVEECREFDLQWKGVFGSNTRTCACLAFKSITELSSASASSSVGATAIAANIQTIIDAVRRQCVWLIMYPNMWRILFAVLEPTVESVVLTDSRRQGKVCFRNSELREARTSTSLADLWYDMFDEERISFKFFEVPELRLPKSGFLMKEVILGISKVRENSAEDNNTYNDMLNFNFEEEENVFGEALNLILGTPKERRVEYHQYVNGFSVSLIKIV